MRLPYENNAVEQRLPYDNYAVEQGLPHVKNAVEQRLPPVQNAVERRFPHVKNAVEQRLPLENAMVEQRLPFADDSVAQQDLRDTGMVETEFPCLEEGEVSSSESSSSETSFSSSGSRRLRKSKRNRSGTAVDPAPSSEILNVVEYSEGSPNQVRAIEVANPPSDAATITRLPGLSWKHFLRDLKAGEIEQVCLLTGSDQPDVLANAVCDDVSSRLKAAEPKSVREARFAAQSWSALQDSNNPVYSLAASRLLHAERWTRVLRDTLSHVASLAAAFEEVVDGLDLIPRQWPLPRHAVLRPGHLAQQEVPPGSSRGRCPQTRVGGASSMRSIS
ncbi:hypothetical protein PF008_g18517 [Phytophthora fragariae]|uniref:Uncharacterized protein n=1 Tax=Phytophthora fragariae TaxID=53985 RepID=A0A6G0R590_9STRA|nr:hypothetical protein PF008_g18517 [Phytophthora fragariae]